MNSDKRFAEIVEAVTPWIVELIRQQILDDLEPLLSNAWVAVSGGCHCQEEHDPTQCSGMKPRAWNLDPDEVRRVIGGKQ